MRNVVLLTLIIWLDHCSAYNFSTFSGQAFPPPSYNSIVNSISFQNGKEKAEQQLRALFGHDNKTSAMILVRTAEERTPIFSMAWDSASTPNTSITADTVFRIGSISKVYTVFTLLMQQGFSHFDDLVTDHIPELRCASGLVGPCPSMIEWDHITLGALAGQLAGVFRDYNAADLSTLPLNWVGMGLPPLNASEIPICAANETSSPCTREQFFKGIQHLPPVFQPYASPAYSNAAFRILAYALAAIAKKPFDVIFEELFLQQLNLTSTSLSAPSSNKGAIVPGDASWAQNVGDQSPAAGIYSSAKDLTSFANAILSNTMLSPEVTMRWLKPTSFTARMDHCIGMPWDIYRTPLPLPGHRIVDLYAKGGSIGVYASELILIPDYNISIAVLTSGDSRSFGDAATNILLDAFLPELERVAAVDALKAFGGNYSSIKPDGHITLQLDAGPGLVVQSWTSNGSDLIQAAAEYARSTGGGILSSVRLLPADLSNAARPAFRCVFETIGLGQDEGVFRLNDGAWASVDQLVYGREALDLFVFDVGPDGRATTISNAGLRSALTRD